MKDYLYIENICDSKTIKELADYYNKTERGVKVCLTRRKLNAKDYITTIPVTNKPEWIQIIMTRIQSYFRKLF